MQHARQLHVDQVFELAEHFRRDVAPPHAALADEPVLARRFRLEHLATIIFHFWPIIVLGRERKWNPEAESEPNKFYFHGVPALAALGRRNSLITSLWNVAACP